MSSFFKRWSSLKAENSLSKTPVTEELIPTEAIQNTTNDDLKDSLSENENGLQKREETSGETPIGPQLADVEALTAESDFSVFMNKDVAGEVHQAAMKKLFTNPHFNVMDGLDIYIDDYSIEDPLPEGMLEKMYQSEALGLFKPILETNESDSEQSPLANNSVNQLTIDSPDALEKDDVASDISPNNTPLISHQEQFDFSMSNSKEPTESVEPESLDLLNIEVKNKDDNTRL